MFFPFLLRNISGLESQVAFATLCAAEALSEGSVISIKLIVKGEFLVFVNVSVGEDADANLADDVPLDCDAVGTARVVDEPGQIAFVGGVDHFNIVYFHEIGAGRLGILLDSSFVEVSSDGEDFPYVLEDKGAFGDELAGSQTETFSASLNWIDTHIHVKLESSVSAILSAWTEVNMAFCAGVFIQTSFPTIH